jgi:serpin B
MNAWKNRTTRYTYTEIPEFTYDYDTELSSTLKSLGMQKAFSDQAEFGGMFIPNENLTGLKIDKVIHKTHIEVDKEGTKVAASTSTGMLGTTSCPPDPVIIKLDKPFVYAIVDTETGIPLFIGTVKTLN